MRHGSRGPCTPGRATKTSFGASREDLAAPKYECQGSVALQGALHGTAMRYAAPRRGAFWNSISNSRW